MLPHCKDLGGRNRPGARRGGGGGGGGGGSEPQPSAAWREGGGRPAGGRVEDGVAHLQGPDPPPLGARLRRSHPPTPHRPPAAPDGPFWGPLGGGSVSPRARRLPPAAATRPEAPRPRGGDAAREPQAMALG